jgi:hypothetical protein
MTYIEAFVKCWKTKRNNDYLYNSNKDELLRIETMLFFSDEFMIVSDLLNTYFIDEN